MTNEILFFTQDPESRCSRAVRQRPEIRILKHDADFLEYMPTAKAAIVDVTGDERQVLLKALLKEKLPFAICGLEGETPDSLKRLCAAAKRRHLPLCWLGSWRFEWNMARLKEIVSSGALGAMQQFRLTKPEEDGIFERLRDEDLMNWLSNGNEATVLYESAVGDNNYTVTANGSRGIATAIVRPDGTNEFNVALDDGRPYNLVAPSQAWEAEIGCLLFAIRTNRPWNMLGRVPN